MNDSEWPNPPYLSQMSRGGKSSTHQGEDMAIAKPSQNSMIKGHHDSYMDQIYDFGTDEERFDHNNNADPAEEAHAGGMLETSKKVAANNKGLGKSGKGNGWLLNESKMKGKAKMVEVGAQQEQVSVE